MVFSLRLFNLSDEPNYERRAEKPVNIPVHLDRMLLVNLFSTTSGELLEIFLPNHISLQLRTFTIILLYENNL